MAAICPKEADVVVLSSPLYFWIISGQLKMVMNRLFALKEGDGLMLRENGKADI
jgi:multimeric flavodoxin WrbA